jgi:hypothetical protein
MYFASKFEGKFLALDVDFAEFAAFDFLAGFYEPSMSLVRA